MLKMTKREKALEGIRIEVALNGEETITSMRLYVENRVGYPAYREAVRKGMAQYKVLQSKKTG